MAGQEFPKSEKLCNRYLIADLFKKGNPYLNAGPVRFSWIGIDQLPVPCQVLFLVPKRRYKRSHTRNRIKRQLRELYRLNKSLLVTELESQNKHLVLMISYSGPENLNFAETQQHFLHNLNRLVERIQKSNQPTLSTDH